MPNFAVTLNTSVGIASITYGSDPHNFVDTSSTVPIFRAGLNGGTKNYQALTTFAVNGNTFTMQDSGGTIAKVAYTWSAPAADQLLFDVTITNLSTTNSITEWDLKSWSHLFEGNPSWDQINVWSQSDQGYDVNAGLAMQFIDLGQTTKTNPCQIWWSDTGTSGSASPVSFHFGARGSSTPALRDVYNNPDASQPTPPWDVAAIAPSGTYTFSIRANFYSAFQNVPTAVPGAYSIQKTRWPMQVNQTKFPTRSAFGLNFLCADGKNYTSNPNGWNNDSTLALYNSDGTLQASTGSYTGLNNLYSFISGRVQFCNYITHKSGGLGVITWDFWWGGRYPQPGVDYVGDPTVSQTLCPELWYSDANFTPNIVTRMVNSVWQYAYNPSDPTHPTYLGTSWMIGAALRGSVFSVGPPASQTTYATLQAGINDLTAKINFLTASPYNHTIFYIDSFGPFNTPASSYAVELLRTLMTNNPNILLIPESYSRADVFSATYPWRDLTPTRDTADSGAIFTPQAPLIWSSAACACRFENKGTIDMDPTATNYPNAVYLAQLAYNKSGTTGDCVIANCYSGTPTELEQITAIYTKIANGTVNVSMPYILSISPSIGSIAGGETVTITGAGFFGGGSSSVVSDVLFGSTAATSYTVNSDTSITATAPAESKGVVDIRVKTESAAVFTDQFTYKGTSFVQGNSIVGAASTTTTCTFNANTVQGNTILMTVSWAATTGSVSTVTDTGNNTYTKILSQVDTAHTTEVWYATNAAPTNSVTVTATTSIAHRMIVAEYSGAVTITASASGTGTGTAVSSGNASTTNVDDTLIGICKADQTVSSEGTGYTARVTSSGGFSVLCDQLVNASGAYAYSCTLSASSAWTGVIVILHPS